MKDEAKLMDCIQFKEIYHELDRPGTSGYRFRERALSHAEACPRCGALLTEGEALDFALRNLAESSARWEASPRIEANLLRELQRAKLAGSRQKNSQAVCNSWRRGCGLARAGDRRASTDYVRSADDVAGGRQRYGKSDGEDSDGSCSWRFHNSG